MKQYELIMLNNKAAFPLATVLVKVRVPIQNFPRPKNP